MDDEAAAAIGSLAEPVRRDLYAHVSAQREPVSRDHAAEALGIPRHTAKFHLDRLVDEGLLEVDFQRLTGLNLEGEGGGLTEELPTIQRWLNRILALRIGLQNAIFDE